MYRYGTNSKMLLLTEQKQGTEQCDICKKVKVKHIWLYKHRISLEELKKFIILVVSREQN